MLDIPANVIDEEHRDGTSLESTTIVSSRYQDVIILVRPII